MHRQYSRFAEIGPELSQEKVSLESVGATQITQQGCFASFESPPEFFLAANF